MSDERRYRLVRLPCDALPWLRDLCREAAEHCRKRRDHYARPGLRAALATAAEMYDEIVEALKPAGEEAT